LAARGFGLDCFVRLAPVDYASVMRPLETGAGGIMAAQVRTSAEVERIVRWTYFYPLGERGLNGLGADGRYGSMPVAEYIAQANSATMLAIQRSRGKREWICSLSALPTSVSRWVFRDSGITRTCGPG